MILNSDAPNILHLFSVKEKAFQLKRMRFLKKVYAVLILLMKIHGGFLVHIDILTRHDIQKINDLF